MNGATSNSTVSHDKRTSNIEDKKKYQSVGVAERMIADARDDEGKKKRKDNHSFVVPADRYRSYIRFCASRKERAVND